MGMGLYEDEEELRRRQAEATSQAIDGLLSQVSDTRADLNGDDFSFADPGHGEQTFPGDYGATSQTRDLAMSDSAIGALVDKSNEPDPAQQQLAVAERALAAQNNPDPMPDTAAAPAPAPVPESLVTPPAKVPLDLSAGGGGEAPGDEVERQIRDAASPGNVPNPADPSAAPAGEGPTADPDPGKGVNSNVERSPQAKEIPELQPGEPASPAADDAAKKVDKVPSNSEPPKAGSAQTLTQAQPDEAAAEPDFAKALTAQGEEQRRQMLESMGDRPGVNGWALLADVLFNRGKSIPQIIGQADSAGRAYDDDKRKALMHGSGDPVQQQLELMRLQGQAGTLEQRKAEAAAKTAKDKLANEEDQAGRKAFLALHRKDLTPEQIEIFENAPTSTWRSVESTLREKWKQSPGYQTTHADGRKKDSFAGEEGTIQARAANLDTAAHNTSVLSAADANAKVPANIASNAGREANTTPIEAAKEGREAETARRAAEEVLRRERERKEDIARADKSRAEDKTRQAGIDAATRVDKDAAWLEKFGNDTKRVRQEAPTLGKLLDSVRTHREKGESVPGLGVETGDSFLGSKGRMVTRALANPDDPEAAKAAAAHDREAVENQSNYRFLSESVLRANTGAAANMTEDQRNAITTAQSSLATTEEVEIALGIIESFVKADYQTYGSARPDLAYNSLKAANLGPERWGFQAPAAAPQAPPTSAAAVGGSDLAPTEKLATGTDGSQVVTSPAIDRDAAAYLAEQSAPGADPAGGPPLDNIPLGGSGADGNLGRNGGRNNVAPIPVAPPPDPVGALADAGKAAEPLVSVEVYQNGAWQPKMLSKSQILTLEEAAAAKGKKLQFRERKQ